MIDLISISGDKISIDDHFIKYAKILQFYMNSNKKIQLIQSTQDIKLIVSFYLKKNKLNDQNIVNVLMLSQYFDIKSLTKSCYDFLKKSLDGKSTEEIRKIMKIDNDLSIKDINRISKENYFIENGTNKFNGICIVENPTTIQSINILKHLVKVRKLDLRTLASISRLHSDLSIIRTYPYKFHVLVNKINFLKNTIHNDSYEILNKCWKNLNIMFYDIKTIIKDFQKDEYIKLFGLISHWKTFYITDMNNLFFQSNFNEDISRWDTSNVTNMSFMFHQSSFNQDISNWNVSKVTNIQGMFKNSQFNQDISKWDTSSVTDMGYLFYGSKNFSQDISEWNTSNVTDMTNMFQGTEFNPNISKWNLSSISNINDMVMY